MKYVTLIILMTLIFSCNSEEKKDRPSIKKIFYEDNFRVEYYKKQLIMDTIPLYHCEIFDTSTNKLTGKGEFIKTKGDKFMPCGWVKTWDHSGKIDEAIKYDLFYNDSFIVDISQNIKFGIDSLDTIYSESSYFQHKLSFISNDSVNIRLWYRGKKQNESNFAFESVDKKNKFLYRTNKPYTSFNVPKYFFKDSTLSLHMIQTYDHTKEGGGQMRLLYYKIKLH